MTYNVKYKKGLFWKNIKNVVGDGYIENRDIRYFILENGSVVEVSVVGVVFKFPPEREGFIADNTNE